MTMQPLKARVKNGRFMLDEPTALPEGEEVELVSLDDVLVVAPVTLEREAPLPSRVGDLAVVPEPKAAPNVAVDVEEVRGASARAFEKARGDRS